MERFFKNDTNLIENIKKNKILHETPNVGLHLLIYLLYKYEQLALEECLLVAGYDG